MNILITGASGLVGSSLVEFLFNHGHSIFSLQRNKSPNATSFWNFNRIPSVASTTTFDAVIHLAGENIATGRWSKKKKSRILDSRVNGTRELAEYCAGLKKRPKVFIGASAIGFYGNQGNTILDESSGAGTNFVAEVCREWEKATAPAKDAGIRVVHGRIGMVLSGKGGTLTTMLPSFKLGIAGVVGDGSQYVSWVGIQDLVSMFLFVIDNHSINGPINLVAPEPVTNREFTKTLGKVVNRPTILKMPAFVAKIVFGQMGKELLLSSTRAIPHVLQENGYNFLSPDLEKTLTECIQSQGKTSIF